MAVQQKGANGLIAEYVACERLAERLSETNRLSGRDPAYFSANREAAERRVGNELSEPLILRARRQGESLGDYIFESLLNRPEALGLEISREQASHSRVEVSHVGFDTNSGVPEDILLVLTLRDARTISLPISIKAYRSGTVSLGSKSSVAALTRLFLNRERVSSHEFREHFGQRGAELLETLELFKKTAKVFYSSDESREFLDAYERRKGTRKVNNPLRRKEVGEFFRGRHGYLPEHRFAELFCAIFNESFDSITTERDAGLDFVKQLRFILANPEVLALNAVAETATSEVVVDSSLNNPAYRDLNAVLQDGLTMRLLHKEGSSIVGVRLVRGTRSCQHLSLAVWKDATIQFKLQA